MAVAILLLAICLGALGQILLKSGLGQLGDRPGIARVLSTILTNARVFGGFLCYGVSSLFYLVALSRLPLSYAYPMIALSYVIVTYLAWQLLGERVPLLRIGGLAIILVGVVVVALTYGPQVTAAPPQPGPAITQSAPPAR